MQWVYKALYRFFTKKDLPTLRKYGKILGRISYRFAGSRKHVALTNARIIGVPDPEKTALLSFEQNMTSFLEIFYSERIDEAYVRDHVTVIGEENIRPILDAKEPYFFVSAHIGSWEMVAQIWTILFDTPITIIGRKIKNDTVDAMTKAIRGKFRVTVLPHRDCAADVTQCINDAVPVGSLLDHSASMKDCIMAPLFGKMTPFIAGVPAIAARKKIPVVPFFLIRTDAGNTLYIYPPIRPDETLKAKDRILDIATRINRVFEDIIKQFPDQWYLIHKRFKKIQQDDGSVTENTYQS